MIHRSQVVTSFHQFSVSSFRTLWSFRMPWDALGSTEPIDIFIQILLDLVSTARYCDWWTIDGALWLIHIDQACGFPFFFDLSRLINIVIDECIYVEDIVMTILHLWWYIVIDYWYDMINNMLIDALLPFFFSDSSAASEGSKKEKLLARALDLETNKSPDLPWLCLIMWGTLRVALQSLPWIMGNIIG